MLLSRVCRFLSMPGLAHVVARLFFSAHGASIPFGKFCLSEAPASAPQRRVCTLPGAVSEFWVSGLSHLPMMQGKQNRAHTSRKLDYDTSRHKTAKHYHPAYHHLGARQRTKPHPLLMAPTNPRAPATPTLPTAPALTPRPHCPPCPRWPPPRPHCPPCPHCPSRAHSQRSPRHAHLLPMTRLQ